MLVNLSVNVDSNDTINKELLEVLTLSIRVRHDIDLINPVLILKSELDFTKYNHCEMVDLNRHYFIDSVELIGNDLYKLSCSVDVLESYKEEILVCNSSFHRNVRRGDYYQGSPDVSELKNISIHKSDVTLPDVNELIMITVGGE